MRNTNRGINRTATRVVSSAMVALNPTICAWMLLWLTTAIVKTRGFHGLYRLVSAFRMPMDQAADQGTVNRILDSLERASSLYIRRVWCLQKAAVGVCLLRVHGVKASLVMGCCLAPVAGHAWIEVDGRAVGQQLEPRPMFLEIDRI
jgi:hypothetical protein